MNFLRRRRSHVVPNRWWCWCIHVTFDVEGRECQNQVQSCSFSGHWADANFCWNMSCPHCRSSKLMGNPSRYFLLPWSTNAPFSYHDVASSSYLMLIPSLGVQYQHLLLTQKFPPQMLHSCILDRRTSSLVSSLTEVDMCSPA